MVKIGGNYSDALKQASTGTDGKQYFMPFTQYPWGLFYRKSVWQERGYAVPKTLDELVALSTKMKADGLVPIAFAQKQGWPGMGTFDQLNFRTNGYQFHVDLLAGKEDWQDKRVKDVFDTWKRLLPFHQENALGREWQEAAQIVAAEEVRHVPARLVRGSAVPGRGEGRPRLLPVPGDQPRARHRHGRGADRRLHAGEEAVQPGRCAEACWSTCPRPSRSSRTSRRTRPRSRPTRRRTPSGYRRLQKKAAEVIKNAKHITQFLDRDTDPGFASEAATNGLIAFIKNPDDIDSVLKGMADQAKNIFK